MFRHPTPLGPAAARNWGARIARAPLIFFLDADVAVHPRTLGLARARFEIDRGLSALFGSYDASPAAPGIVSQYRNLLHHFVHQQGTFEQGIRPAHTFWTGCGVIRRDVFLDFGGFDPGLYPRPAIEDIELGYRLTRAGHRIVLARDVLATHMKRWTLREMVRTDIFSRGVPWTILLKRTGTVETDLNVKLDQKACVVLTGVALLSTLACPITAWAGLIALASVARDRRAQPRLSRLFGSPQGTRVRMRRASPAPDLLLLLRALGRDRPVLLVYQSPLPRTDSHDPRHPNGSRHGLDSQTGGRTLGAPVSELAGRTEIAGDDQTAN